MIFTEFLAFSRLHTDFPAWTVAFRLPYSPFNACDLPFLSLSSIVM